jgi:putative transposase
MRPDPEVETIFEYCLGEAAGRYSITLHGWIAMSNHEHLSIRDNLGNFPAFLAHFHKLLAKCLNHHWGRCENVFATEQPSAVWCVEPADGFDKLIYLLVNPVADMLVDRVAEWPGASSWLQTVTGVSKTVTRPLGFFPEHSSMPETVTLRAEKLAGFEHLSDAEWSAKVVAAVVARERKIRELRRRTGRRVFGREAVLRARPTDTAVTVEPRRGLRPQLACKNKQRRVHEALVLKAFRYAYGVALKALRGGVRALFPEGTYKLRMLGALCAFHPS